MRDVIIFAKTDEREIFWKFTKSATGTIDYAGRFEEAAASGLDGTHRKIEPSAYFTRSDYIFLRGALGAELQVAFSEDYSAPDKDEFAFYVHIAPVLLALEEGDTLLIAELLARRSPIFEKFASIVRYLLEPCITEIFFSELYTTFYGSPDNYGKLGFLAELFEKKISFAPKSETISEAFIRYFKEKKTEGERVTFSLPIVGVEYGRWDAKVRLLNKMLNTLRAEDLDRQLQAVRKAKHDFYASLSVSAQIEPYNEADKNAVTIFMDDVEAKLSTYGGKVKAGYVRRTGAEILRLSRPELLSFDAALLRISGDGSVVISLSL